MAAHALADSQGQAEAIQTARAAHALATGSVAAGGRLLKLHLARMETSSFRDEWFGMAGIDCPPNVARSVPKRRTEYFYGRLCARGALLDLQLPATQIGSGPFREPLWPAGVIGSITHNHSRAAAVALIRGDHRGVGIDIERRAGAKELDALLKMALSPDELACLAYAPRGIGLDLLATIVFSAKESFFKATFGAVGRYFGFEAVAVTAIDPATGTIAVTVREALCAALLPGMRVKIGYRMLDPDNVLTAFLW